MKRITVNLDNELAAKLKHIGLGRAPKQSEFIRNAFRHELWKIEEIETARAYHQQPDSAEEVYFNSDLWEKKPAARAFRIPC